MVRRIVGALVEVGRGKMKTEEISDLLNIGINHRSKKGVAEFTAPPSGLFLEKIIY